MTSEEFLPTYPIYIPSKGRYKTMYTMEALELLGVPYNIMVEPQEYKLYQDELNTRNYRFYTLLELPFSNHGKGSGPARNFGWEHSIAAGHERHWMLDDNIREFWRFQQNQRIRTNSGAFFKVCEDFVDRYENVALAGLQYKFFVPDDYHHPPYILNTRLMSCILIQNSCPHRWRGKYNEDVDLSLRVLKDGFCTVLFYAYLQGKLRTGTVKGGNTEELYGDGTFEKSKMLAELHPDVVKLVRKYDRWHHEVNMRPFRKNKLILKKDIDIPKEPNEYGMKLVKDFGLPTQEVIDKPPARKN